MKIFLALCALVAVAAANYYPKRDALTYVNDIFDVKPSGGYYDSFEYGPRPYYGKKHHRDSDSSSSSDSSSDSDSDSSSGSHERPRKHYKKIYRPVGPSYGETSNDAPANSAYGAPAKSPPQTGYGNTYGRK